LKLHSASLALTTAKIFYFKISYKGSGLSYSTKRRRFTWDLSRGSLWAGEGYKYPIKLAYDKPVCQQTC